MYKNTVIYSLIKTLKIIHIIHVYLIYQYKLCMETKNIQGKNHENDMFLIFSLLKTSFLA